MSRPKGSKNKPKVTANNPVQFPAEDVMINNPVVEIPRVEPKKRGYKGYVPEDPTWVLTETSYGTPIAITDICKNESDCYFVVVPNYRERNSKTTIHSASVIKPVFNTPEIEKEFEGIVFATEKIKQSAVLETTLSDVTLNDVDIETDTSHKSQCDGGITLNGVDNSRGVT